MDIFDSSYFRINKLVLSLIGLWPYQGSTSRQLTLSFGIFGLINFCVPQVIYVFKFLNNLDALLTSMPTSIGGIILVTKFFTCTRKTTEMRYLLNEMREDWNTLATKKELKILEDYAESSRKYTISYGLLAYLPLACYILYPLNAPILDIMLPLNVSRPRLLPHPAEYFVDQDKHFYILMCSECIGYFVGIMVAFGSDTMYIVFVQHCCGMFAILRYYLENVLTEEIHLMKNASSKLELDNIEYHRMAQCIRLHTKTKRFAQLIASVLAMFLSVDIIIGIVMHSTASVMIIIYMNRPEYVVKFGAVIFTQSLRLFLSSWPGQELMDHSASVAAAAYSGMWYRMSAKAKKLLLLLMMDSQRPYTLTFAKIYIVNLDSYGMIMKTSLSYCTVMASFHDSFVS